MPHLDSSNILQEEERYCRDHWLSLTVDSVQPRTLTYVQEDLIIDSLLL